MPGALDLHIWNAHTNLIKNKMGADMGRIYIKDATGTPASVYSIKIFNDENKNGEPMKKTDIYAVESILRRYHKKYPYASFLMVESTTGNVKGWKETKQANGHIKYVPIGKKVPLHIHIAIIGGAGGESARQYTMSVMDAINKRFNKTVTNRDAQNLGREKHACHYINYCVFQMDKAYRAGDFNWEKYIHNEWYVKQDLIKVPKYFLQDNGKRKRP